MKVSCIIPVKNRKNMVGKAVSSVLAQDYSNLEVIVVDDGSIDGTPETLRRNFPEMNILQAGGRGAGYARNAGVKASSAEIVMFLDSDDIWLRGHVTRLVEALDRGFQVAYGITVNEDVVSGEKFLIPAPDQGREGDCYYDLLRWCYMVPSTVAVRRQAFEDSGGFEELPPGAIGEDWLFFLELAGKHEFGFAGIGPLTRRVLHAGSLCRNIDQDMLHGLIGKIRNKVMGKPDQDQKNLRECLARFDKMEKLISYKGRKWNCVQQWYNGLKKEALV